ncbi:MAG TPA: hypothetical protein VI912_05235 [Candidatus Bilamarchaeaceae archaeon]|nr:hypothetical protein [Candidatus Bilamarchaeaceae archaeon]
MVQGQKLMVNVLLKVEQADDQWKIGATFNQGTFFDYHVFFVSHREEAIPAFRRYLEAKDYFKGKSIDLNLNSEYKTELEQIPEKPAEVRKAVPARREAPQPAGRRVQVRPEPPEPVLARSPARTGKQSEAVRLFLSKQQADFDKFKEEIAFKEGSVQNRQTPRGALTQELIEKRNNIVMELYNQLLQREDFKLFVAGLDSHPELSSSFRLDGKFNQTLELGLRVMQTFLSSQDPSITFRNFGQFDLQTAEALRKYLVK